MVRILDSQDSAEETLSCLRTKQKLKPQEFVSLVLCVCSSCTSQCKKYRDQFTDQQKLIYEEKLEASELFKDKKALYPSRCVCTGLLSAFSDTSQHLF